MPRISGDPEQEEEITDFLAVHFRGYADRDIFGLCAQAAIFLSNRQRVGQAADRLSKRLHYFYLMHKTAADKKELLVRTGVFCWLLGRFAGEYGFERELLVLNGQVADDSFRSVLASGHLFRDIFSTAHGEYAHALQWLLLASALGDSAPMLYRRAHRIGSTKDFQKQGTAKKITLWEWLVDCFDTEDEDYTANVNAPNFRSPQYLTRRLRASLPAHAWLPAFIEARSTKYNQNQQDGDRRPPILLPEGTARPHEPLAPNYQTPDFKNRIAKTPAQVENELEPFSFGLENQPVVPRPGVYRKKAPVRCRRYALDTDA